MSKNRRLLLAIAAFIFFSILFCLPGSSIPKDDWLGKIWADKWVHIGIFTVLVFLWSFALEVAALTGFIMILMISVLYGLLVEVVQHRFIPNRSFDYGDLVADFIGSITGILFWRRYKKNKPL